jgi:hypothetical protein
MNSKNGILDSPQIEEFKNGRPATHTRITSTLTRVRANISVSLYARILAQTGIN